MKLSVKNRQRKNRRRWFALGAFVCGLFAASLVAEVILRVYVAGRGWTPNCYATGQVFFIPDPQTGHTLRPGLKMRSSTYDISVNRAGFRGPEISLSNPSGAKRVAVLGGSSVFGYLVPDGQDSCRVMERLVQHTNTPIEVINAGVPGFNLRQCRYRYESQVAQYSPETVILYLGWNDTPFLVADQVAPANKLPPAPSFWTRTLARSTLYGFLRFRLFPARSPQFAPPASAETKITEAGSAAFVQDLKALLDSIRSSGATPVISTQVMAASAHCTGLEQYLGSDREQIEANRQIGQWISDTLRKTAEQQHVQLIDCAGQLGCDASLLGDAIHLTKVGHEKVAELWVRELSSAGSAPPLSGSTD